MTQQFDLTQDEPLKYYRIDRMSHHCTAHHSQKKSVEIFQQRYELFASGKVLAK